MFNYVLNKWNIQKIRTCLKSKCRSLSLYFVWLCAFKPQVEEKLVPEIEGKIYLKDGTETKYLLFL